MIRKKLDILKENQVINQETLDFNLEVLQFLKERQIIDAEDEADTFITHLAMAMTRSDDEAINVMEDYIFDEIKNDKDFKKAQILWKEIEEMTPVEFHENETGYFYLHLINLL